MKAYAWPGHLCLWLCLALTFPTHALDPDRQYFQYQYVEAPNQAGLGHGAHAVVQDKDGFLWIAADRGLIRFDGHDAEMFRAIDHAGLISNRITDLWITRSGDLLIASEQGMSRHRNGVFESIVGGNKWSAYIRAMTETDDGVIWLGSARGLIRWSGDELGPAHTELIGSVTALHAVGQTLYVGSGNQVLRVEGDSVLPISVPATLSEQSVTDLTLYKDQIWGITQAGIFYIDGDKTVLADHPDLAERVAEKLLVDKDNNLWFYGQQDIGRFLPNGDVETPNAYSEEFGIGAQISAMTEDRNGRIWMASSIYPLSALMDSPLRRISYGEGLLSAQIQAVSKDADGEILLATAAGINRLRGNDIDVVFETEQFAATPVRALLADGRNGLWLGTTEGLRRYDVDSGKLTTVEHVDPVPVNALISAPNDLGTLWIGTDLGLQKWYNGEVSTMPALTGVAVESLFFDTRGTLWIGTETGLVSMGEQTLTLHASDMPATLDAVLDITQLSSGQILATTRNHGLIVSSNEGWIQYTERQGLPRASIVDIELHDESVWLTSTAGLFRFDTQQIYSGARQLDVRAIISLEQYRAMHVDLCCSGDNGYAAAQHDGLLAISTRDGVITLDISKPDALPRPPEPYVKSITINDAARQTPGDMPLVVSSKEHRVRIDYSALSLEQDGRLEFRYRLRGRNDAWLHVGRARTVYLANLPPGDFYFDLQASVTPGLWRDAPMPLHIRRQPVITETLAFRAALWCGSVALVLGLIWLRTAVTRRRHYTLESRIRERTQTLSDVNAQLQNRNQDLRRVSETDALTGLLNRRYFDMHKSSDALDDSLNDQGIMIMIDIDHFKRVNDTWGHAAGDEVLRQFADVLRATTRESDMVARWGGEEFMLLCRCQKSHAPLLLERMIAAVRSHAFSLDNDDHISVHSSLGAVLYPLWPGQTMDDRLGVLFELADAALYRVKSCGRDGWALLDGATAPANHLRIKRAGPLLSALIADGHLSWQASRPNIKPDDALNVTRTG
ncbi:MAG: diguanylate cyclase [Gammaproteobacteria bacterium]